MRVYVKSITYVLDKVYREDLLKYDLRVRKSEYANT